MPIYEYYCPDNNTIYQFFAKTLAQGQTVPKCPDNPKFKLQKTVSAFAITGAQKKTKDGAGQGESEAGGPAEGLPAAGAEAEDPRMAAALQSMEKEISGVDEEDPRSMGRLMRRMADLTGEKLEGEMEEVVRKLEEGTDPEKLEDQLGGSEDNEGGMAEDHYGMGPGGEAAKPADPKEPRHRYRLRRSAPLRDPKLYDYD